MNNKHGILLYVHYSLTGDLEACLFVACCEVNWSSRSHDID
jgi:hypothetical protein